LVRLDDETQAFHPASRDGRERLEDVERQVEAVGLRRVDVGPMS
jgi:hypothetical protein